ncbi:hypothetical protein DWB61_16945 [Ancylomarina euxinus]|uniref:Polysaccharide biosynthesis protein n=1 Tax=Ancylomarina euxinus TaxID=2283627 RepID=A0A425XWR0_9BACT|nr:hypothetical protein [Ancylomarina euxinus]MCZ4696344.1 hypothetical protein [Ancylomarina euxinus]MUP16755.1 hypothetical protein [Ancylomarina euxinus]RRG19075.1 hypothetical protein DWB61_16945 [Ancylomarina euxinus]
MIFQLAVKLKDLFLEKIFMLLAIDKIFQFTSQLLVVFIYREYIGLSNFANYIFALVFFTVISTVSSLGMDRLLLEKFSIERKLSKWNELLFSSIFYKIIFSIIIIIIVKLFSPYTTSYYGPEFSAILYILSFGLIGQSYMLIDAYCQAKKINIITVKSRITVVIFINLVRFAIVYYIDDSFTLFLWTFPIEQALYFFFSFIYGKRYFSELYKYVNFTYESKFLKDGFRYTFSILLMLFQLKYVFSFIKVNMSQEFYNYFSIVSNFCDISFSIPALLSLYYRPDLARFYFSDKEIFKKHFFSFLTNMVSMSIIVVIAIAFVLFLIFTFSYDLDLLYSLPLYVYLLTIPLFYLSFVIQVFQITSNNLNYFMMTAIMGSVIMLGFLNFIKLFNYNSILIITAYLLAFFLAQIVIPLLLHRKDLNFLKH